MFCMIILAMVLLHHNQFMGLCSWLRGIGGNAHAGVERML